MELIDIGYASLIEFDSELFDKNVIDSIQNQPRNDLFKLFGSKSSLHCTPVIIKTFSKSLTYRSFARVVIYLLCFALFGNWEAGK